jgi:aminopeptidase N
LLFYLFENLDLNNICLPTTTSISTTSFLITTTRNNASLYYRLPKSLIPFYYDITLSIIFDPLIEPNYFNGTVSILFTCREVTNHLIFHKANLEIYLILITRLSDHIQLNFTNWSYDGQTQLYDIALDKNLDIDQQYSILLTYTGIISNKSEGLFKSKYTDQNGDIKWLVSLQTESTFARDFLPCFDEPEMKAIFELKITHNRNLTAISNMPEKYMNG